MTTETITNLTQAGTFFKKYGCSSFHMMREEPERHCEYKNLGISKKLEQKWRAQEFARYKNEIKASNSPDPDNWWRFNNAADIAMQLPLLMPDLLDLIRENKNKITGKTKIIFAETILGRGQIKYRSGVIFKTCENGQKELMRRFLSISEELISEGRQSGYDPDRHNNAQYKLAKIRKTLKYSQFRILEVFHRWFE